MQDLLSILVDISYHPILLYLISIGVYIFTKDFAESFFRWEQSVSLISSYTGMDRSSSESLLQKVKEVSFKEYFKFYYSTWKGWGITSITVFISIISYSFGELFYSFTIILLSLIIPITWEFIYGSKHYYYKFYKTNSEILGFVTLLSNYFITEIIIMFLY